MIKLFYMQPFYVKQLYVKQPDRKDVQYGRDTDRQGAACAE